MARLQDYRIDDVKVGETYGYNGGSKFASSAAAKVTAVEIVVREQSYGSYSRRPPRKLRRVRIRFEERYRASWSGNDREIGSMLDVHANELVDWSKVMVQRVVDDGVEEAYDRVADAMTARGLVIDSESLRVGASRRSGDGGEPRVHLILSLEDALRLLGVEGS